MAKQKNTMPPTLLVTRSVLSGQRKAKWFFREKGIDKHDTGWRVVGDGDTQGYINQEGNVLGIDIDTFSSVEPLIYKIVDLPLDTELERIEDESGIKFKDCHTEEFITIE